ITIELVNESTAIGDDNSFMTFGVGAWRLVEIRVVEAAAWAVAAIVSQVSNAVCVDLELVTTHVEFLQRLRAVVQAGVTADEPELEMQFEITHLATRPKERGGIGARMAADD